MSRAEDLLNSAAGGGSFLGADEKRDLYVEQTSFMVKRANPLVASQWGDQTTFEVVLEGEDEVRILAFKHNEVRQRIAETLQRGIEEDGRPVGPYFLDRYNPKNGGKPAWAFSATPVEQPATRAKLAREKASENSAADDVPY